MSTWAGNGTSADPNSRPRPAELATADDAVPPGIRIAGLRKSFRAGSGQVVTAVDSLDIEVASGELLALLGPSGCGKTTTLRCVAGLEEPDEGEISIGDRVVVRKDRSGGRITVPAEKRNIGMVFQSYALWPHMTVMQNVQYPLTVAKRAKHSQDEGRVEAVLDAVGCRNLASRYPNQLSGGQQQRVALARALVSSSSVVLFDEPLSNLDVRLREEMRSELVDLHEQVGFSGIYVTHDQAEAMAIASRIAVMREGQIEQLGTPYELYENPASAYVASFLGSPQFLPAKLVGHGPAHDDKAGAIVQVETRLGALRGRLATPAGRTNRAGLCIRPERVEVLPWSAEGDNDSRFNEVDGVMDHIAFMGDHLLCKISVNGGELRAVVTAATYTQWSRGEKVRVRIAVQDLLVFTEMDADDALGEASGVQA